jgi:hypothetical protein
MTPNPATLPGEPRAGGNWALASSAAAAGQRQVTSPPSHVFFRPSTKLNGTSQNGGPSVLSAFYRGFLLLGVLRLFPGLVLMLLKFRFRIPAPIADGPGLFRGGMPVFALPCVVVDAGAGDFLVARIRPVGFFTHIQTLSQSRDG